MVQFDLLDLYLITILLIEMLLDFIQLISERLYCHLSVHLWLLSIPSCISLVLDSNSIA